jgi:hypothetical protein
MVLCLLVVAWGIGFLLTGGTPDPLPSTTMRLNSTEEAAPPTHTSGGLQCIQRSLGGTEAFAAVSSLRIIGNTKSLVSSGPQPLPGRREIVVIFPDRYKRSDLPSAPAAQGLASIIGFDRDRILSHPRLPDNDVAMRSARSDLSRQMLMRLPRESAGFRLWDGTAVDAGKERLAIEVAGTAGYRATLLADRDTCIPLAVQYQIGVLRLRVDLSDYRTYGGIRFPTRLTTVRDGVPFSEERVSVIDVNPRGAAASFGL